MNEFKLPDVGEGLTEAEIVLWHVVVGDVVDVNDTLVEIETAKSVVELPSPVAGIVATIHVDQGMSVDVGTVLVTIQEESSEPDSDGETPDSREHPAVAAESENEPVEEKPLVLVGTGPSKAENRRRRLRPARDRTKESVSGGVTPASAPFPSTTRAKPPVRLLAKQLGVDISSIAVPAGALVSRSDVEKAASGGPKVVVRTSEERETRVPIKGVRKAIAAAMTTSAFTAPHVTEWLTVDVTRTMDMVARLKADRRWAGVRITPLVFVARAFLLAIRRYPEVNAQWDDDSQEIVIKHFVNLGIAAATPRGLLVPNIKDAHTMELAALADAMGVLVGTARAGKTSPAQMAQGTVTITNIGALGVDAGTPILNPGEAAILAFGAVRDMPWVVDGEIIPRKVTQLAMSFDHRLVDGELGSHVLAEVGRLLSDPGEAFLYV